MDVGELVLGAGILIFVASSVWQGLVLVPRSNRYRTDVPPGSRVGAGASPFWQWNVYNPANYQSEAGRKFFRKLAIAVMIQMFGGVLLMFAGAFLDPK